MKILLFVLLLPTLGFAADSDPELAWRPMDYRRHAIESFPGTYGDRLAEMCGAKLSGSGMEEELLNALYRVIPQVPLKVVHEGNLSRGDGDARRIDGLEFKIEPRGLTRLTRCFKLKFHEAGRKLATLDLYSSNGLVIAKFLREELTISVDDFDHGMCDVITLKYGANGQVQSVDLMGVGKRDVSLTHYRVVTESDFEGEWTEVPSAGRSRMIPSVPKLTSR